MSGPSQVEMFCGELDKLVHRFGEEFDMTYAEIVGSLHIKAHALCCEAMGGDEDDEDGIEFEMDDE